MGHSKKKNEYTCNDTSIISLDNNTAENLLAGEFWKVCCKKKKQKPVIGKKKNIEKQKSDHRQGEVQWEARAQEICHGKHQEMTVWARQGLRNTLQNLNITSMNLALKPTLMIGKKINKFHTLNHISFHPFSCFLMFHFPSKSMFPFLSDLSLSLLSMSPYYLVFTQVQQKM